jgi:hypothetical protein
LGYAALSRLEIMTAAKLLTKVAEATAISSPIHAEHRRAGMSATT